MAYCDDFHPDNLTEATEICKEFIEAVKVYKPALLQKPKFHLYYYTYLKTCLNLDLRVLSTLRVQYKSN